ncbi:MAG: LysM peptidoglycan-binding domain-containing protein [Gemmatimonadales bacterium]
MQRTTIFRSSLTGRAAMAMPMLLALAIAASAQAAAPATYTVKPGDTLWSIARTELGDPYRWRDLHELNRSVIPDPNSIPVGTVLRLREAAPPSRRAAEPPSPPAAEPPSPPSPPAGITVTAEPDTVLPPPPQLEQGEGDPATALFRRRRVASAQAAFRSYRESKPRPLTAGEFISSGFLTEGQELPFGTFLGSTTPEQIAVASSRATVQVFTQVALTAPEGGSYAPGDTLLVVDRREGPAGYGDVVAPTGLVRVIRQDPSQAIGEVVAVYGAIRQGQAVLPAPKFQDPGPVEYQPVTDGKEGQVLMARDPRELRLPHQVLFIDLGRQDGVALGDRFEARRTPGQQDRSAALAVDEPMATLEVVQVREHSAAVKVVNVLSPNLPPGTRVKQVARLPQ